MQVKSVVIVFKFDNGKKDSEQVIIGRIRLKVDLNVDIYKPDILLLLSIV